MTEAYETYIGWLAAENKAFADACERDVNAPVPTCPGWSVLDLLAHHASYQTWIAQIVTERLVGPRSPLAVTPPDGDPIGWYRAIGTKLIKAFQSANAHAQVWSVTNQATVSAWARRQASETSVHRWDAQNATGVAAPLRHAKDYLSEMFDHLLPGLTANFGTPIPAGTIRLCSTDEPFEWTSSTSPSGHRADELDSSSDVTVTGTTSDLFLSLWNRPNATTATGDQVVLDLWRSAISGG